MSIKYATHEDGIIQLHHNVSENVVGIPHKEAIELTDEEYEKLATGQATLVKGKVVPV